MCMCVHIAVTVPEKEMMYAKLNCVFLDTLSPALFLATVCSTSSPVSAKYCGSGEGIANNRKQSLYISWLASALR